MFAGIILYLLTNSLFPISSSQEKPLAPKTEIQDSQIEAWVKDLSSSNFDEREIGASRLLDLGERALPFLEKAVRESKDSELRWNAKRLIREIREKGNFHSAPNPSGPDMRKIDEMMRQMREQQERMREMMDEQLRQLHDPFLHRFQDLGEEENWGFDFDDFDRRIRELEDRMGDMGESMRSQSSFSFQQGPDGVRLEVQENVDGKVETQVYEAQSVEDFKDKYPEIAKRYGIGVEKGNSFRFRFRDTSPRGRMFRSNPDLHRAIEKEVLESSKNQDRLGVYFDAVEPSLRTFLDLEPGVGFLVKEVEPNSLAQRMGIQAKDVLVEIQGQSIRGPKTIRDTLQAAPAGSEISVNLIRPGQGKMTLKANKEKAAEAEVKKLEKVETEKK